MPPPRPVPTADGYTIECPICRDELDVNNQTATTAERSRLDVQIHLLAHIAWMTEEQVFPGSDPTPST